MQKMYGIKLPLLFSVMIMLSAWDIASAQVPIILEAEAANLSGDANIVNCNQASGGEMVRGISQGVGNSLEFQDINIPEAGTYFVKLSYLYVSDRTFTYRINNTAAQDYDLLASGAWCFEGGGTADFIFQDQFEAGSNTLLFYNGPIIDKIEILADTSARQPAAFYLSVSTGRDDNDGLSPSTAWQTLSKANSLALLPGDSLLFRAGDIFPGQLSIKNESGSEAKPIFISQYGEGAKPIIDGIGYESSIHIQNSGYLHLSQLEIKNDGGPPQAGESTKLRQGIYIENTFTDGTTFDHYYLHNLTFKNIYPTDQITDDDQTGVNAYAIKTSGSWGDDINPTRFNDFRIENCFFTRVGRHAALLTAINNLEIRQNLFEHIGGAGMVIGNNSSNILVEKNTTNYTGSSLDSRMAGRGSGIWAFRTTNLVVQHNKFMHARGIKDSFGMHIDIGNRNVVYQYNYSEDNEGGFAEILGANVNVGYRYNLSVGDGWRSRGNQLGRVFWIGGWSGNPQNPIGSDSVFIYHNSVFVRDSIQPRIWIEAVTKNTRICNNIVYAPNGLAEVFIKNDPSFNEIDRNIWWGAIPTTDTDGDTYRGENALTADPLFVDIPVTNENSFVLQAGSPAMDNGKILSGTNNPHPFDYFFNSGGQDYFGNVSITTGPPTIGAVYGAAPTTSREIMLGTFKLFPNPIVGGRNIAIEIPIGVKAKLVRLQLIDAAGKLVAEHSYKQQRNIRFKINRRWRGHYFLKVNAGDYQATRQLLVR